jgi:hypothetical protein
MSESFLDGYFENIAFIRCISSDLSGNRGLIQPKLFGSFSLRLFHCQPRLNPEPLFTGHVPVAFFRHVNLLILIKSEINFFA